MYLDSLWAPRRLPEVPGALEAITRGKGELNDRAPSLRWADYLHRGCEGALKVLPSVAMRTTSTTELETNPGRVMALARQEGAVILTENGVPQALLVPTSEQGAMEDAGEIIRLRAKRALAQAQAAAAAAGVDGLSAEEIDEEIQAARCGGDLSSTTAATGSAR